jgi:hypothetical protein
MESTAGAKIKDPPGVPTGASGWYYSLAGALSDSQPRGIISGGNYEGSSSSEEDDDNDDDFKRQLVIAWDKPPKDTKASNKKVYGVFKNHLIFWENLTKLPEDSRYAYEVLPAKTPCRGYWDIEFCLDLPSLSCMDDATVDTRRLMQAWIEKLKHIVNVQLKMQAIVSVLDGTRIIVVTPPVDNEPPPTTTKVKFSFHVVLVNVAFVHNQSRAFQSIQNSLPTLYNLSLEISSPKLTWIPPKETKGAPDMCVYGKNQLFRSLSCAKRGNSTPLVFSTLTDSYNPQETFVSILDMRQAQRSHNIELISEPKKRKATPYSAPKPKKKRAKLNNNNHDEGNSDNNDDPINSHLQDMLTNRPQQMENIHNELQKLLIACGDSNTRVEKLVRATKNLRYQCRNVNSRSCILSSEDHQSNNPILWLDSSSGTNVGELASHYKVIYNCKSSECQGQGIIGEILLVNGLYVYNVIMPPIIDKKNPKGKALKAMVCSSVVDQSERPGMKNFISMLNNNNDNNDNNDDDDPIESNGELIETRDLMKEKLNGFAWTNYDLQLFGRHRTYQDVKSFHEKTICRITSPSVMFLKLKDDGINYDHYSYEGMQKLLKCKTYYRKNMSDAQPEIIHFFGAWTDDEDARSYNCMVSDPSKNSIHTGPKDLNIWPGFNVESMENILDLDMVQSLVEPIVSHILNILVSGIQAHADWFLDWLANIVQRPEMKTQVPIVISGKQGVGKGIIIDFFREAVLGNEVTSQIQNAGQDLFSRFANKHINKVLLQIDEGDGLAKYADHLKNLTTASYVNYEIKGLMSMTARNYINIIITTNHERPVLVETSDRRFVLFKASDIHLGNPSYYSELGHHLHIPKVARAFYQFLMARDLSKYVDHFQTSRPMTEYYLQNRKSSISVLHKFISSLINSQKYTSPAVQVAEVSTVTIFKDFIHFLEQGRFQNSMTSSVFSLKLKNMEGILKKSNKKGTFWSLDYPKIKSALVKNNEFDDDITFD